MSDVLRVLTEARELISDESRWTQGVFARACNGIACIAIAPIAECWCAYGAVQKCGYGKPGGSCAGEALHSAARSSGAIHAYAVNDHQGHAATLAMFDAAIASEQAKAGSAS